MERVMGEHHQCCSFDGKSWVCVYGCTVGVYTRPPVVTILMGSEKATVLVDGKVLNDDMPERDLSEDYIFNVNCLTALARALGGTVELKTVAGDNTGDHTDQR